MTQDRYQIQEVTKGTTERGQNYYDIKALDLTNGEQVLCTYFGTYYIGIIQPHTSRDKRLVGLSAARVAQKSDILVRL